MNRLEEIETVEAEAKTPADEGVETLSSKLPQEVRDATNSDTETKRRYNQCFVGGELDDKQSETLCLELEERFQAGDRVAGVLNVALVEARREAGMSTAGLAINRVFEQPISEGEGAENTAEAQRSQALANLIAAKEAEQASQQDQPATETRSDTGAVLSGNRTPELEGAGV